jgi:hypothetical protein
MATFIWGREPDAELRDVAGRGRLKDPAVIDQQVRRMLADPKSQHLAMNLLTKWFRADLVGRYPSTIADDELRRSLVRETQLFFDSVVRQDRSVMEIWTANYTFVNERLARHYGIPNITGNEFRRITLVDETRFGLLGQGSVLAGTALFGVEAPRTSPTLRGKWLMDVYWGFAPPPPPPNTPSLSEDTKGSSVRKRIEAATATGNCGGCHRLFDPMGFALENFDVVGRWRTEDGGESVDAASVFADGTPFNGPVQLRNVLLRYRESFLDNLTNVMLSNALGRGFRTRDELTPGRKLYPHEMQAVRAILRDAEANNFRWSSLISGIVKSPPFQMKTLVP